MVCLRYVPGTLRVACWKLRQVLQSNQTVIGLFCETEHGFPAFADYPFKYLAWLVFHTNNSRIGLFQSELQDHYSCPELHLKTARGVTLYSQQSVEQSGMSEVGGPCGQDRLKLDEKWCGKTPLNSGTLNIADGFFFDKFIKVFETNAIRSRLHLNP